MKILLVSSYRFENISRTDIAPPLGVLALAAVLRQSGMQPEVLDLNLVDPNDGQTPEDAYIAAIIGHCQNANEKTLIGFSCLTTTHFPFMRIATQKIKQLYPTAKTCLGGVHATLFINEIMHNCPEFDYVISGEGEEQIVALAHAVQSQDWSTLVNQQALGYRDIDGNVVINPRVHYIKDLDTLPMPAWDMIDFPKYYRDHTGWRNPKGHDIKISIPLMTTRSCPYDCNFCSSESIMGRGFRKRSPKQVVDEIEYHVKELGHNYFGFADDNLTLRKDHIMAICNDIVKRKLDIQFESFNGYNLASLDDEVVAALVAAGCVYVILPIEHGNDYMRNTVIGKRLPREKIFEVNNLYRKHKLLRRGVFIMGFPEDTPETLNSTRDMINDLDLDLCNVFSLIPFPGTKVFKQIIKDNLLISKIDVDKLWTGDMGLNTGGTDFYVKPYAMSIDQLSEYRGIFDQLATERLGKLRSNNGAF